MKIAIPWPSNAVSQERVKKAIVLWKNIQYLLICMVEPSYDDFLNNFNTCILPRNSKEIGTTSSKLFIKDMMEAVIRTDQNSDWFGFGNSDIVPRGNLLQHISEEEVLIYHRTEIKDWSHIFFSFELNGIEKKLYEKIFNMRFDGISDKRISKYLNVWGIKPPDQHTEWTYLLIREIFSTQGEVFFWGQHLFLFRKDVVKEVIDKYLKVFDPILGSGGFDPRMSRWLMENFKCKRILNKIFHKRHASEWSSFDTDYKHNGGDIPKQELIDFYGCDYYISTSGHQDKPVISKYARKLMKKLHVQDHLSKDEI